MPPELQREMVALVQQTKRRSGWSAGKTLEVLQITRSTYQRWQRMTPRPRLCLRNHNSYLKYCSMIASFNMARKFTASFSNRVAMRRHSLSQPTQHSTILRRR